MTRCAQPVTITVPSGLLALADRVARKEGRSRSELFREALRSFFWKRRWEELQSYASRRATARRIREDDIEGIIDEVRARHRPLSRPGGP